MSAEAIARLRAVVAKYQSDLQFHPEFQDVEADLRALLDAHATLGTAHTEALDALALLALCMDDTAHFQNVYAAVTAVLAKAGRR